MNNPPSHESGDARLDRLKAGLREAQAPAVDSGWKRGVMAEIHALAVGRKERLRVLHQTLRHGAVAAAAVALVTAGLSFYCGQGLGLDFTRLVALEPDALLQLVLLY